MYLAYPLWPYQVSSGWISLDGQAPVRVPLQDPSSLESDGGRATSPSSIRYIAEGLDPELEHTIRVSAAAAEEFVVFDAIMCVCLITAPLISGVANDLTGIHWQTQATLSPLAQPVPEPLPRRLYQISPTPTLDLLSPRTHRPRSPLPLRPRPPQPGQTPPPHLPPNLVLRVRRRRSQLPSVLSPPSSSCLPFPSPFSSANAAVNRKSAISGPRRL